MARCPKCRKSFATLEDETDMHDCPYCGYSGEDKPEPEEDADKETEDEDE